LSPGKLFNKVGLVGEIMGRSNMKRIFMYRT
jgi:hypothetical protein